MNSVNRVNLKGRNILSILGELSLILSILLVSQGLQIHFNLPVPATIIGMVILILMLSFSIIKLKWIENITELLLGNLSILFIPAGVGIMKEFHFLQGYILPVLFILTITTIIIILVTGYTVEFFIKLKRGDNNGELSR